MRAPDRVSLVLEEKKRGRILGLGRMQAVRRGAAVPQSGSGCAGGARGCWARRVDEAATASFPTASVCGCVVCQCLHVAPDADSLAATPSLSLSLLVRSLLHV